MTMNLFTIESSPFWLCKNFGPPDLSILSSVFPLQWSFQHDTHEILYSLIFWNFILVFLLNYCSLMFFLLLFAFFWNFILFSLLKLLLTDAFLILSFLINFQFRFLIVLQLSFKLVYHHVIDNWLVTVLNSNW